MERGQPIADRCHRPLAGVTHFVYDAAGNVTAVDFPDGSRSTATYDALGLPAELTDPAGRVWRTEHDERGNRLATVDPAGARTEYAYDESGNIISVTDALGARHLATSDPAGLLVAVTDPLGRSTTARRDAFGRIVESTDPMGNTVHFGWTVEGQLAWCERADGTRDAWQFDAEGNVVAHTDAMERTETRTTAPFDLVAASTSLEDTSYTFTHDTERRLRTVSNPAGRTWEYAYDALGRLVRETDFDGRSVDYTYDAAGQLTSWTNHAGETVTFSRDILGRLLEHRHGDDVTTFSYDVAGRLRRAANTAAEIVREYDPVDRVLSETVDGRRMEYAYDPLGRPVGRRTPEGVVSTWTYDPAGAPRELTFAGHTTSFNYDEIGRETGRRLGVNLTLTQTWDSASRLSGQEIARGSADQRTVLQKREYRYRADDFLIELRELTTGTRRFDVDHTGRVVAVEARNWTEHYAYDAMGNLTRAVTPDTGSQGADRDFDGTRLRRAGRTSYEYDHRGRPVRTVKRLLNGQTRVATFTWNAEDQLVTTVTSDGTRWRYRYDPTGRRIAKERLASDGTIAEGTRFVWDGTRLAERSTSDGRTTTWEYGPQSHRPLAQADRGPSQAEVDSRFHLIVTDLVGTPTELVSPDGKLSWHRRTTVWGVPVTPPAADGAVDCPLRFPGQYADPETGWNFNYFRHYEPETARYVTPDPLGLEPSSNPTAYVSNPFALIDPLGLGSRGPWEPDDITWGGRVTYGERDAAHGNRATGVTATIQKDMLGGWTNPSINDSKLAGWESNKGFNRTHLLGALIGGSNKDLRNFVTMHRNANSPVMLHYETQVRNAALGGATIKYKVTPLYDPDDPKAVRPIGLTVEAHSTDGKFKFTHYGSGTKDESSNRVTVLNVKKCTGGS